jgi:hypothetical protein
MPSYYTIVTPQQGLPCSAEEARRVQQLLDRMNEDEDHHGFEFVHSDEDGLGYLQAEECGDWDSLPADALAAIGELISRAGLAHLECGAALTCSRMLPGTHTGSAFRILPSGQIVYPEIMWPSTD